MGFAYHHLGDEEVRSSMSDLWRAEDEELHRRGHPRDCYGKLLTDSGWEAWSLVMPEALASDDDDWLREQMSDPSFWVPQMARRTKSGVTMVNYNKPDKLRALCYGEFNIAYIHGLGATLLERGEEECIVYRADAAYEPRGECSSWEDRRFPTQAVLDGHRVRYWPPERIDRAAFSVPTGPNCHHSIRSMVQSETAAV
jgi:hypothetical protein